VAGPLGIDNCECDVYLVTTSYKGAKTETLEHSGLEGWLEEGNVMTMGKMAGGDPSAGLIMGSAELFLWDDVSLKGRIIKINGTTYEIISWHRFVDTDNNTFSHLEIILR
jgi:hypothetical protein